MATSNKIEKIERIILFFAIIPLLLFNNMYFKHYAADEALVRSLFNLCMIGLILCNILAYKASAIFIVETIRTQSSKRLQQLNSPLCWIQAVYLVTFLLLAVYLLPQSQLIGHNILNRVIIFCLLFAYFLWKYSDQKVSSNRFELIYTVTVLAFVVGAYLWPNLSFRVWTYGDEQQFLCNILSGKSMPMFTLKSSGRFYPFGFVEYNWIKYFDKNKTDMVFMWLAFKLLVSIASIGYASFLSTGKTGKASISNYFWLLSVFLIIFLCSPETLKIYNSGIYIESSIVISIVLSIMFYLKGLHNDSLIYYAISAVLIFYSLYLKETVFIFYSGFIVINIGCRFKTMSKREIIYFGLIITNIVVFLILYYLYIFIGVEAKSFYNEGRSFDISRWGLIVKQLKLNPIFVPLYAFALYRGYKLAVQKERALIFPDSLLAGCVGYSVSFIALRLCENYMFVPCYALISIVAFSYINHYIEKQDQNLMTHNYFLFVSIFFLIIASYHTSQYDFADIKLSYKSKIDQTKYTETMLTKLSEGYHIKFLLVEANQAPHLVKIQHWKAEVINRFLTYFSRGDCRGDKIVKTTNYVSANEGKTIFLVPEAGNEKIKKVYTGLLEHGTFFGITMYEARLL